MRARLALAVFVMAVGPWFAVPASAQSPSGLVCTGLTGTFSDTWDPIFTQEEIPSGALSVQASGTCVLDGVPMHASVSGSGRSDWGGVCGALTWSTSMDPGGPSVRPTQAGDLDITLTLTPSTGSPVQIVESWQIPATEQVESVPFVIAGGHSGAGNVTTRVFLNCPGGYSDLDWDGGGTDRAWFTWAQTA